METAASEAAVPASERLDLHKVRELLADERVELASGQELSRAFPRYDVGAVPPVGPGVPRLALLDERVAESSPIVCSAGDHRHALLIIPAELVAAASPRAARFGVVVEVLDLRVGAGVQLTHVTVLLPADHVPRAGDRIGTTLGFARGQLRTEGRSAPAPSSSRASSLRATPRVAIAAPLRAEIA